MKKIFKKLLLVIICIFTISLSSCSKYVSSYKAVGLVRINTSSRCETSFYSLEGTLVFKLKNPNKDEECAINYFIQLDEGEVNVYYDYSGTKEELVTVTKGETIESQYSNVEGKSIYIIIEASKGSRGKIIAEVN